jgi:hypothetical protein
LFLENQIRSIERAANNWNFLTSDLGIDSQVTGSIMAIIQSEIGLSAKQEESKAKKKTSKEI